MPKWQQSVTTE